MITSPQLARCRRHRSPLIADRSASALVLPSALPQGISLFFSLTLSLYLTEMKKWNEIFTDRRSVIGDRRSLCLCSGAAVLVAPSGSPALPQGFSLWLSLRLSVSLSLFISLTEKMKWNLWTKTSLSLYTLIAYLISVSLSLFWTVSLWLVEFCFFSVFFSF